MIRLAGMAAIAAVAGMTLAGSALGNTYKPTRFDDPTPSKCKRTDCSLREAITAANKRDGADKVKLRKGIYALELPETVGDDNAGGDLDVVDEVAITGKGAAKTKIDGQDVSRVMTFLTFSAHSLAKLTIKDGDSDSKGGGLFIGPSKATIRNVVFRSNTSSDLGGGIASVSTKLKIVQSTFDGNHADTGGGGLYLSNGLGQAPDGQVRQATFSANTAGLGAGIYVDGTNLNGFEQKPTLDVVNSTIAQNQAEVSGGGVAAIFGSTLSLDNTTVAYNVADSDNSGGGSGGGMFQSSDAEVGISDIILGENSIGTSGSGPQCFGSYLGGGLIAGSTAGCTVGGTFVADARIGALGDYGGPTQTISLDSDSPAIDRPGFDCPRNDQRGRKRDAACDTGAFERKPNDP